MVFSYKCKRWVSPDNLSYSFNEIDGKVKMNFTLTIHHRLVPGRIPFIILPRYTVLDHLWIAKNRTDYFDVFNETMCTNPHYFDTYTINLTEDMQTIDLETNGQQKNLTFYLGMSVDAGKHNVTWKNDGTIWRAGRIWSFKTPVVTQITIIPIVSR